MRTLSDRAAALLAQAHGVRVFTKPQEPEVIAIADAIATVSGKAVDEPLDAREIGEAIQYFTHGGLAGVRAGWQAHIDRIDRIQAILEVP